MLRVLTLMVAALLMGCTGQNKESITVDSSRIQLSAEEAQFVASQGPITWAAEEGRPPFMIRRGNTVSGISVDYLNLISKKTGLKFQAVHVKNLKGGLDAVYAGSVDIMTAIRPTAEREELLDFTPPFTYSAGVFVFRQNSQPGSPLRAGLCEGDASESYLRARFPDMIITKTRDMEEAISLLEKGVLDVAIMSEATADYLTHKSIIKFRKASTDFDYPLSFGYRKENVILGSILSKAIQSISVEEKKSMNEKWTKEM